MKPWRTSLLASFDRSEKKTEVARTQAPPGAERLSRLCLAGLRFSKVILHPALREAEPRRQFSPRQSLGPRWSGGLSAGPCQTLLVFLALLSTGCGSAPPRVVVYCAQDKEFAEGLFEDFTRRTGRAIAPHYDTEATKSVGLYRELVEEAGRPRCDVFWNNEILGTIRLQRQGLLEPYDSPAAAPYPARDKAADHSWHAFAARARILIVNTNLVKEADRPTSLLDLEKPEWKSRVAMAKPAFGTTATQVACLFEVLGPERAKAFYHRLHENQLNIVSGNKQVAEGVGAGQFAVGLTDTDDAMEEIAAGHPVAIVFPDRDSTQGRMGTLFLPNTLALIRGTPHPEGAKQLIDDLLSADSERRLAEDSGSHQFPLNPQVKVKMPKELTPGLTARHMAVDFEKAADLWEEAEKFLRQEFQD